MSETKAQPAAPKWKPRIFLFVVAWLLVAAVVLTITFSGMRYLIWRSDEQHCRRELGFFSKALISYHNTFDHFPPPYVMDSSGRLMNSWRPLLIRFRDVWELYVSGDPYKWDEPWDGPANTQFRNVVRLFECPVYANGSHNASYLCVVGGEPWPVPKRRIDNWTSRDPPNSVWTEGGVLPSNGKAILLVEVVESDIPWTKPEDISISEIAALLREDRNGDRFRRRIRHVVAVDAAKTLSILDPVSGLDEIKTLVESEAAGKTSTSSLP